jgi:eukaryotic-like serine/threonine-protein kinase
MEREEMSTKIGHFEILSELAKSPTGAVYKANDPESGQVVALKAIQLSAFGESAQALKQALLQESEAAKVLGSPNITPIFGAGEFDGQFCAAMEYVQGNSIATMLARKEGFSIWDLLDIGRQLCNGFDHASSKKVVHYSLEPSKIMCGWDGTVRILSFGVSSVGNFAQHVSEGLPTILHYTSPEQVQGQPMDGRSNLFSLGAMFYEMVTERKAFDGDDITGLRQNIVESTPVPPIQLNGKVHPLLSDLIMKTLAKDPAQRFQTGREMLDELEKCKESKGLAAKKDVPKGTMAPAKANAAAQAKFIGSAPAKASAPVAAKPAPPAPPKPIAPAQSKPAAPASSGLAKTSGLATPASRPVEAKSSLAQPKLAVPKAAAAAVGAGSNATVSAPGSVPELDLSDSFINASVKATLQSSEAPSAHMSSAMVEPEVETFEPQAALTAPRIAVDPMMAEGGPVSSGTSFSEISELPPLKEEYVAPPPPPAPAYQPVAQEPPKSTMFDGKLPGKGDDKPKVQPREVAEKAIKEIKNVPAKLMWYALGGAGILILLIAIGVTIYVHTLNSDDDSGAARPTPTAAKAPEVASQPAPQQAPAPPPAPTAEQPAEAPAPEPEAAQPVARTKPHSAKKKAPAAPVIIPGQLSVDSTPQGAQVQLDGRSDPSWVTPLSLNNLQPGQHSIITSKAGYTTDTRTVNVTSGNRTTSVVHLSQLTATLVVKSDPPGANIYVDGRNVGAKTPAQVSVDKGQHVVLVRMMGYLDETMNGQFVLGQTFNFSPTLRPLGNADSIHSVGKMSKLFGGKGAQAGQATLSIRTQPKGAEIAINQHLMEKNSPLDVALDPGNYVIDITLTGYAPIHKVVTADKGGKVVVDEVMQRQ